MAHTNQGLHMAHDKELIQKLLKIAEKQQQIITKMAQKLTPDPQKIEPKHPELHVAQLVMNSLPHPAAATVESLVPKADTLEVYFRPGQASQQALDTITYTVQHLLTKGKLPFAYKVKYVQ